MDIIIAAAGGVAFAWIIVSFVEMSLRLRARRRNEARDLEAKIDAEPTVTSDSWTDSAGATIIRHTQGPPRGPEER